MLNKKCPRCNAKIKDAYSFCPSCGQNLSKKEDPQEWGMIGKNDFENMVNEIKIPKGVNMLINSLAKSLDKQFRELDKDVKNSNKRPKGISISIGTGLPQNINPQTKKPKEKTRFSKSVSEDKIKKMSKLKKEEPETMMKRLTDSIMYEIKMPGVKSIEDISINSHENSVEVKGLSKDKTYFKIIPFSLPITNYTLEKDNLVLEFKTN